VDKANLQFLLQITNQLIFILRNIMDYPFDEIILMLCLYERFYAIESIGLAERFEVITTL
jgi:hypothetical protein